MNKILFLLLTFCFTLTVQAFDNDLQAVAKQPGTNLLYVGGEFNSIMILDETTGETIRQIKIETKVLDMQFNPKGDKLITFDGERVRFMNPETGEVTYDVKAIGVKLFENAPYFVDVDWIFSNMIKVYSTEDGSPIFNYSPDFKVQDAGFDADFKEMIVLGRRMDIKGEKAMIVKEIEEEEGFNVYNKAYVEQQSDKKGTQFVVVDMASKKELLSSVIPYTAATSYEVSLSKYDGNYYLACWDMLLRIDSEGKSYPIESKHSTYAYATKSIGNQQFIFVGSGKDGYVYNCEDQLFFGFDAKENNEFSYTIDFSFEGESIYMLSDDFKISVLNNKGMIQKRLSIEQSSEEGFGLYYTNGFNKKEARDAEAIILNRQLEKLGMETIDLESGIGESNFLVAIFPTMDEAKEFQKSIDADGLQYLTKIAPYSSDK